MVPRRTISRRLPIYGRYIKAIDEQYEKANEESDGFRYKYHKSINALDKMLDQVPQEYWVQ